MSLLRKVISRLRQTPIISTCIGRDQRPIPNIKRLELIPGLNVGGFFDAGDFDIETGSNIGVVQNFVQTWESFKPLRDETFVDEKQRYVDLHRPDGTPDVLQFIEHGTLNLIAQAENIGHMAQCSL